MRVVSFRYHGRFGHFLQAEANIQWFTYPHPPRTALLGLLGALLGLPKDRPQELLQDAHIAVSGPCPATHWHTANIRKDPPGLLTVPVKKNQKGTTKESGGAKQIPQEWLLEPDYTVYASLSAPYQEELERRLREQEWHYCPCMGLSEMIAQVEYLNTTEATLLPEGAHTINSLLRRSEAALDTGAIIQEQLALRFLRMPRAVTPERVFSFEEYAIEREGRAIPVHTSAAWQIDDDKVMFL